MAPAPVWEDEHTEIVPRIVVARRRRAAICMMLAIVALLAAAATLAIPHRHRVEQATRDALAAKATQLGVVLDEALKKTRDRAEGFAGTPVLEAGILTDAATVADIVKTEFRLRTKPNETLELFQLRGDAITSLVRVPASAPPLRFVKDELARVENRGGLAVVVSVPVAPYNNTPELSGQLALGAKVDLAALALAGDADEAVLVANGLEIELVPRQRHDADAMTLPVSVDGTWKLGALSLRATPAMSPYVASWVPPVRYAALALGVTLLAIGFVVLARAKRG
ncbi:MAG: hypothetical protein HOV81_24655 [Kofleriaceae bacterium]|nr:hypothetical protein [Kofleriaceae bacterium]